MCFRSLVCVIRKLWFETFSWNILIWLWMPDVKWRFIIVYNLNWNFATWRTFYVRNFPPLSNAMEDSFDGELFYFFILEEDLKIFFILLSTRLMIFFRYGKGKVLIWVDIMWSFGRKNITEGCWREISHECLVFC